MSRFESIEDQAAQWLTREDRGLEPSELATFEAWLNASTEHKVAYLRLSAAWQRVDRLGTLRRPASARPELSLWDLFSYRAAAAAAATLVLVCLCIGGYYIPGRTVVGGAGGDVYSTQIGQQQTVRLTDGTRVELNTNTRLRPEMTSTARVVTLERGEAYFDVARDPGRPFVVYAGNRKITDVGTKFSVRREGDHVEVMVAEGRVRVDMSNAGAVGRPVEAVADSIIIARADGTLVAQKSQRDIADKLSWRQGMLVFNQETLGAAAGEFNRYSNKHIIVVGAARNLRIGGRFRPDNVEVFTSLIKEGFGLKIEDTGGEIVVSE
jgi:transmembrane sensor